MLRSSRRKKPIPPSWRVASATSDPRSTKSRSIGGPVTALGWSRSGRFACSSVRARPCWSTISTER